MSRRTNSIKPPEREIRASADRRSAPDAIDGLKDEIRAFARERDWDKYHTPKNLSMALAIEAGELMEIFQWLTPEESRNLRPVEHAEAEDEIGDVMIYLVRLADTLSISLIDAARKKLSKSKAKYPVEKARGNAKKYTKF